MIDSRSRGKRERWGNLGGREGRSGGGEKSDNGHTHTHTVHPPHTLHVSPLLQVSNHPSIPPARSQTFFPAPPSKVTNERLTQCGRADAARTVPSAETPRDTPWKSHGGEVVGEREGGGEEGMGENEAMGG